VYGFYCESSFIRRLIGPSQVLMNAVGACRNKLSNRSPSSPITLCVIDTLGLIPSSCPSQATTSTLPWDQQESKNTMSNEKPKTGQKFPTPTAGSGDRVFYETLLRQRPDSAMAQEWYVPVRLWHLLLSGTLSYTR
jgi:hypothetical protein